MMRKLFRVLAAVAILAVPCVRLAAQGMDDPNNKVAGGGVATGWHGRTDVDRRSNAAPSLTEVKFVAMGDGFHATMGPAAIFWRDQDVASGNYHVVATFTQTKAPMHPEAYGLILGGSGLDGKNQRYTYFLVRQDGKFLVKRRIGDSTAVVTTGERGGWVANGAVVKADSATGKATNELSVLVKDGTVTFSVNGKAVYSAKASDLDVAGIVGYRVNHNLDVHLSAIGIHKV
jgi:hypothetical protein